MTRRFGTAPRTKAQRHAGLLAVLTYRGGKPLTDAEKISLSRSHGATISEIERLAAQVAG